MCLPFMWVLRCAVTLCWPASFRSERIEWETANTGIPRLSQAKEVSSRDPLYVGTETIQTAGGPDERNSDLRSELPRSDA